MVLCKLRQPFVYRYWTGRLTFGNAQCDRIQSKIRSLRFRQVISGSSFEPQFWHKLDQALAQGKIKSRLIRSAQCMLLLNDSFHTLHITVSTFLKFQRLLWQNRKKQLCILVIHNKKLFWRKVHFVLYDVAVKLYFTPNSFCYATTSASICQHAAVVPYSTSADHTVWLTHLGNYAINAGSSMKPAHLVSTCQNRHFNFCSPLGCDMTALPLCRYQ